MRRGVERPPRPDSRRDTPPRMRRGSPTTPDPSSGRRGGVALRSGTIIAYPTESFYALGADATNARAVKKIFALKGRGKKPIALIAGSLAQVLRFFTMTDAERQIARRYWPGALTIILKPKAPIPSGSPSGRGRVIAADALLCTTPSRSFDRATPPHVRRGRVGIGVRVPAHTVARKLALSLGRPITATSANMSGASPTKSPHVIRSRFPAIMVVPGRCGRATRPSTVAEIRRGVVHLIRSGAVTIS